MKNVVIFGAGGLGNTLYSRIKDHHNVLFFVDNNHAKFSDRNSPPVLPPSVLAERDFDIVCIALTSGLEDVYRQLTGELGINPQKISRMFESTGRRSMLRRPYTETRLGSNFWKHSGYMLSTMT